MTFAVTCYTGVPGLFVRTDCTDYKLRHTGQLHSNPVLEAETNSLQLQPGPVHEFSAGG
jgi:hypothetical protein